MSKTMNDNMLEAWRKQYVFDAMVSETDETEELEVIGNEDAKRLSEAVSPFDTQLAIGQIRVMTSSVTTEPEHIPYVAILGRWTETSWLVAPFSRFTIPAVRGEMLTGIDYDFHAVLQCWNAKIIPSILLQKSWICGQLPEQVRIDAYDLFRHLATNTPLMDTFQSTVGPALTDPLDIRNNYMVEDKEQLRPLDNQIALVNQIAAINWNAVKMPEQQAAAGDSLNSIIYMSKDGQIEYFGIAEVENFEPTTADGKLQHFIWIAENFHNMELNGAELIFRDKKSQTIIGTGTATVDEDGLTLTMLNPIAEGVPAIENAETIQIIIVD